MAFTQTSPLPSFSTEPANKPFTLTVSVKGLPTYPSDFAWNMDVADKLYKIGVPAFVSPGRFVDVRTGRLETLYDGVTDTLTITWHKENPWR